MQLPGEMLAMVLEKPRQPLIRKMVPLPVPGQMQVLIKVLACGVCRTDLHILDGDLTQPKLPLILGHEIIGMVVHTGSHVQHLKTGDLVGVPWLGYTCGHCRFCLQQKENLCENALFTGYTMDGGYAEYTLANEPYCFVLDAPFYNHPAAAPLLCAGLIGYRCYTMIGDNATHLGIYGFGAAAHILLQVALFQQKKVYAFTRDGDVSTQTFAKNMGAEWAGDASSVPPHRLDAAIIFAPAGNLIPKALSDIDKGGVIVCGGIHMSDIPSFPYHLLWEERVLRSVANLTREDGIAFLRLAPKVPVNTQIVAFPLTKANEALEALRNGNIQGAAVLTMSA